MESVGSYKSIIRRQNRCSGWIYSTCCSDCPCCTSVLYFLYYQLLLYFLYYMINQSGLIEQSCSILSCCFGCFKWCSLTRDISPPNLSTVSSLIQKINTIEKSHTVGRIFGRSWGTDYRQTEQGCSSHHGGGPLMTIMGHPSWWFYMVSTAH